MLTLENLKQAADAVAEKMTERPDVLWLVTSFRVNAFVFLKEAGLSTPNGKACGGDQGMRAKAAMQNMLHDYLRIEAQFPAEVKQTDEQITYPRAESIARTMDVYNGLKSDANQWESAQELSRILATNADSQNERLDFSVTAGIMMRIYEYAGYDGLLDLVSAAI